MIRPFSFATTPHLHFGTGKLSVAAASAKTFGPRILLVTGARSFMDSSAAQNLLQQFHDNGIEWEHYRVDKEPTPMTIDHAVKTFSSFDTDCVVSVGGGSVLDAGKAISAMLPLNEDVKDYLEGVGTKSHPGNKIPFIAVPTTSGTGSEATKNSVISEIGESGYKRSLRHNNFVPNIAIVDPALTTDCPKEITAASGMDAFTQLLESFLSTASNPMTDALAIEGLKNVARSLLKSYHDGSNIEARTDMALASYLSGVTLASAGLGLVHGLASPLGGYFDIPHGVICSMLMAPANRITVQRLRTENSNAKALNKYARVGRIFSAHDNRSDEYYTDYLLELIETWTRELNIPYLVSFGVSPGDFHKIVAATDNKNNPALLGRDEMMQILESI